MTPHGHPGSSRGADDAQGQTLLAHPSSVAAARRMVREVLASAHRDELVDTAQLLVSEVVTNALVHAGTPIDFHAFVGEAGLRVEVSDGSTQAPSPRRYAGMAGTGRGLKLLQQLGDSWGTLPLPDGKTVWFELDGNDELDENVPMPVAAGEGQGGAARGPYDDAVDVVLLDTPLLLHAAWQEHAEAMLREYLLVSLDDDDPMEVLAAHAAASDAISLLNQHILVPHLGEDPATVMAQAVDPELSSRRVVLHVPRASVPHFRVLDETMEKALGLAESGTFLTPPIQPEVRELRRWLCQEVSRQAHGGPPSAWWSDPDVATTDAVSPIPWEDDVIATPGQAVLAADVNGRIVVASPGACELLGYDTSAELVGRRLVAIIPARYHQAHLAGLTLHLSNGRSPLLGRTVVVPFLRRDGSEVAVEMLVEVRRQEGERVFVAGLRPAPALPG